MMGVAAMLSEREAWTRTRVPIRWPIAIAAKRTSTPAASTIVAKRLDGSIERRYHSAPPLGRLLRAGSANIHSRRKFETGERADTRHDLNVPMKRPCGGVRVAVDEDVEARPSHERLADCFSGARR